MQNGPALYDVVVVSSVTSKFETVGTLEGRFLMLNKVSSFSC